MAVATIDSRTINRV